ncbi:MAG: PAS domain S-box protein, partial [Anaerolineales bacterium]|nr:PAS domain S-box protein [Anaerolineales bacterium]
STFGYTVDEWVGTRLSQHASGKAFFQMARKALYSIKHFNEFDQVIFESEMLRKDGTEIPVEITGKLLFNKKGIPIGLQGTTRDIAERVQAEEQNRLFSKIIETTRQSIIITNIKGAVLYVNQGYCDFSGFEEDEVIGNSMFRFAQKKDALKLAKEVVPALIKNKYWHGDMNVVKKDKQIVPVDLICSLLSDKKNKPEFLVAIFSDITERIQAREALQRRNIELTLLNRVIAAASMTMEPEVVLETTCRELALAFNLPQAAAALLNESRTAAIIVAEYLAEGYTSALNVELPIEGNPVMEYVFENKAPLVITDAQKDPRMAVIHDEIQQRGTVSMLILPLMAHGQVVGTLGLDSVERREFSREEIDLAANAVSTAARALENAQLFSQAKRRLKRIEALHSIDKIISSSIDLNLTTNLFLKQAQIQLEVDAVDILLFDPLTLNLKCIGRTGFKTSALKYTDLRLGQGLAGQVAQQREIKHIPNLLEEKELFQTSPEMSEEDFIVYYGIPLIAKGVLKGVLEIFHRGPLSLDSEWLMFSNALAGLAAIAIDNASMFNDLQRSIMDLSIAYDSTLEGWAKTLELRDYETEGHSRRVVEMTVKLAGSMGLPADQIVQIRRGALLHDIGKMGVPDSILQKPGKLTDDEWEIMQQHPVYAFNALSGIEFLRPALEIPHYHHERWDGNGYPQGLKGEEIPLAARIFAIIDVWDALNSDRPYRKAWSKEKILAHIKEQSGKHFDPRVMDAFLKIIELT